MKRRLILPEYSTLLYYWGKLTGLVPFTVMDNRFHPPSTLAKIYTTVLIVSYGSLLPLILTVITTIEFDSELMRNWAIYEHSSSFAAVISAFMIFLIKSKEIVDLMNELCIINNELKSLDIMGNRGNFFKNLTIFVAASNVCVVVALVTAIIATSSQFHWLMVKGCIDHCFLFQIVLIFAGIMFYIKQRFELLNEKLLDVFNENRPVTLPRRLQIFVANENPHDQNQSSNKSINDLKRMRIIESSHLELCCLMNRIVDLLNLPIIFAIIHWFCVLVIYNFWAFFIIIGKSTEPKNNSATIISFLLNDMLTILIEIVIVIAELFIVVHASVETCKQGNATRSVLSKAWDNLRPKKLNNEFFMFSTQLLHKPVSLSVFRFLNLDYSLVYEILGTAMAYLTITMQFDPRIRQFLIQTREVTGETRQD